MVSNWIIIIFIIITISVWIRTIIHITIKLNADLIRCFVYYKHYQEFNQQALFEIKTFITNYLDAFTPTDEEHMETLLTVIVSTDNPVSYDVKNLVERLNPSKSIAWGLKGWIKVKLILIDSQNTIISNKFGKIDQKKFVKLLS